MFKSILISIVVLSIGIIGFVNFKKGKCLMDSIFANDTQPDAQVKPADKPIELNDANFSREVLDSRVPVVVDFWAAWCGPCRKLNPVIEELTSEYSGKIKFGKVNVDENENLTSKYGITSIPQLIIFKDGKPAERIIGLQSKADIAAKLLNYID